MLQSSPYSVHPSASQTDEEGEGAYFLLQVYKPYYKNLGGEVADIFRISRRYRNIKEGFWRRKMKMPIFGILED